MIILSKEQVLKLHASLIKATGGSNGIRDEGMLDLASDNPFQTFEGKELYPSVQAKAARLCFGLVKNHAMVDGNKLDINMIAKYTLCPSQYAVQQSFPVLQNCLMPCIIRQ